MHADDSPHDRGKHVVSRRGMVRATAAFTAIAPPSVPGIAGLFTAGGAGIAGAGLSLPIGGPQASQPESGPGAPAEPGWAVVTSYGARGDGETDDTQAIQAAIDAAEANGGGIVVFPAGVFRCNIVVGPRIWLQGAGTRATTLVSVAGSDGDVIKARAFDELTCKAHAEGDYLRGSYGLSIRDIGIDGDRLNNEAGYGIRIWGASPTFRDLIVKNCVDDGIYTEFTDQDDISDLDDHLEGSYENIKSMGHGGNGFTHRGPHDSTLTNFVAFNNEGWALKVETASGRSCGYIGGISIRNSNSYLNQLGSFYIGSSTVSISNTIASGPFLGTGIEIAAGLGGLLMTGVLIYGHETGLVLRGAQHTFSGAVIGCHDLTESAGNGIIIEGASGCLIDVTGADNHNAVLIASETGPNVVRGVFNVPTGKTLVSGDLDQAGSLYQLLQYGSAGNDSIGTNPFRGENR